MVHHNQTCSNFGIIIFFHGPQDQALPCFSQGAETDFEKAAYPVIVVETDTVSVGYSDKEKINKDFYEGKPKEKSSGNESVVNPTEGTFNFSDPFERKNLFAVHGAHLPVGMAPFSNTQNDLSN